MAAEKPKQRNMAIHLFSGGVAGFCEALSCHPLDTIKVRLQLRGAEIRKKSNISAAASKIPNAAAQLKVSCSYSHAATTLLVWGWK
jgi:solute carrier family 25 citrate transporter 1